MIGIRSAFSIRARGHRPHLEAVYMTAPRSVCRNTKKALPTGGRPYMTADGVVDKTAASSSSPYNYGSLAQAARFAAALTRCSMSADNCLAADERKFEMRRTSFARYECLARVRQLNVRSNRHGL